ncbi:MAG: hypothetical protein K2Y37_26915 [Pirellulales bacterium]|nr:hypothetical protein [Pirellulales bacterium]
MLGDRFKAASHLDVKSSSREPIESSCLPGESLDISQLRLSDIPEVVRLHIECFPEYLLTGMEGPPHPASHPAAARNF